MAHKSALPGPSASGCITEKAFSQWASAHGLSICQGPPHPSPFTHIYATPNYPNLVKRVEDVRTNLRSKPAPVGS
ncbi:hypothetical protein KIN20_013436 [Parelaphostrongylus tenuis]|uniref:Uncharacterized protein n=1 Tax=Parelaphostrongylus tenuis TaxID=148309 RepID=A0AAD5QL13_PARTN|nr:hypothetical protein KIN20_013436 [Parelaphostrongylus tenuis]